MKTISKIVKDTRLEHRKPLRDFAKELGISHMTVSQWESGQANPSPEIVGKLLASDVPWVRQFALDISAAQYRKTLETALPKLDAPPTPQPEPEGN